MSSTIRDRQTQVWVIVLVTLLVNLPAIFIPLYQLCFTSSNEIAVYESHLNNARKYLPVVDAERRFAGVKSYLPANSTIGYIADGELTQQRGSQPVIDIDSLGRFILAQYCLAPVIVYHSVEPDLVLANFSKVRHVSELSSSNLEIVHNFGDGVVLLKHQQK
jgi:hypothetical protein